MDHTVVLLCHPPNCKALTSQGDLLDRAICFFGDSVVGCVLDIVDGA